MTQQDRLAVDEALQFWDQRHRMRDDLRSGGDATYDYASNQVFYAVRLGRLLDVLGHHSDVTAPWRVLDAGCGKGWFSRRLAECGHLVDGIDASEHAVAECRKRAVGGDRWRHLVPVARDIARDLAAAGELEVTQRGQVLPPGGTWKGPVRLRSATR